VARSVGDDTERANLIGAGGRGASAADRL